MATEGEEDAAEALPDGALEQVVEWARSAVLATRRFALDAACGRGRAAAALLGGGAPVIGVDGEVAAVAAASAAHRKAPAAMFAAADAARLPFRDGLFGAVVDVGGLRRMEDVGAAAAEWARVLAPGGRVVLADVVEKDMDRARAFSGIARAARPGRVRGHLKPVEIEGHLARAGLGIESAAYWRLKVRFDRLDAGGAGERFRELAARAAADVRELYEVNEEGMIWRFLALTARKRA